MRYWAILSCLLINYAAISQSSETVDFRRDFQYQITATIDEIVIDGQLSEATWAEAETEGNFWQKIPYFAEAPDPKTEIKLAYDDKYLYVAAKCYQSQPLTITTLKRDVYWDNDGIAIVLDPLNTKNNAVLFGTSAVGVQWDATNAASASLSSDWSNKWFVETEVTDEYWSAEFAIPFKILRYDPSLGEWGMNFVRNIKYCNEFHNWTAVPEGFWPPNPTFAGALIWDVPPTKKTGNFNLIPYTSGRLSKDKEEATQFDYELGLDAKVALTSTLNLDLTLNPDFSQIEADQLVTNLTRFDISLPEQRTFFLENADIFADFGLSGIRPFFSRRIGLDSNLEAVPILFGARATGNINKDNRIGLMNIHSRSSANSPAQNQSAVSFSRQFGRSFVRGLFLNRQAFDDTETIKKDYGRNLSIEGFYQSNNGQITILGGAHNSMKAGYNDQQMVYNTGFRFNNANWTFESNLVMFQENYFTDIGFTPRVNNKDSERDTTIRVGFNSASFFLQYQKRPRKGKIQRHQMSVNHETIVNDDWSFNETSTSTNYSMTFRNTAELGGEITYNSISLLFPFTFTNSTPLPVANYQALAGSLSVATDERKALSFRASANMGGFYNGHITSLKANANYRIQPWGNFSLGYEWNNLEFPEPYGASKITAFVSKIEIGFHKNLLWTTLFQYVDQSEYMGINSRLQWRFSPMSDVFLVYVDNYDVLNAAFNEITSNNRAVILKVNYWY